MEKAEFRELSIEEKKHLFDMASIDSIHSKWRSGKQKAADAAANG